MGDSISEGTVVEWCKAVGDKVSVDEVIVILETDKVSVDVRSETDGVLSQQLVKVEDNVLVGSALATITPSSEANDKAKNEDKSNTEKKVEMKEKVNMESMSVVVPGMGDSISEGTVVEFMVNVGDAVQEDDILVVLETDKVSVDVRAPTSGVVTELLVTVDAVVEVGASLVVLQPGEVAKTKPADKKEAASVPEKTIPAVSVAPVAPVTANVAEQDPLRPIRREKMSRMRLRIAERLKESQNVAASLTTFQECDMGFLMARRKKYQEEFTAKHGVKLGFMSAFIKASSSALLQVPAANASIDDITNEIMYRDFVDMSVAVSTPKGLVTPVLKDTHLMSVADIEKELGSLALRARNGQLTLEEMMGGHFTISNGGVFGSLMGTPILNRPQSAILGMHATKERPVVVDGKIVARPMMYLALTYDHRLVDGREAVTCLKSIADQIESVDDWMDLGL